MIQKWAKWPLLLTLLLLAIAFVSLKVGAVQIAVGDVVSTLLGQGEGKASFVILQLRLPVVLLAIIAGACMAFSGTILQGITKNELADSGILGINSGAALGAILYIMFVQQSIGSDQLQAIILPFFAFSGATITALIIVLFSFQKGYKSIRLVLIGMGVNAGLSALIIALQLKLNPIDYLKVVGWLSGDLWATQWKYVWVMLPCFLLLIPILFYKQRILNILQLGQDVGVGLGIAVNRERFSLLILAVAFASIGVTVGGGLAFIGLIAPHLARRIVGIKHERMMVVSGLFGAIILLTAETIGRTLFLPVEFPAGMIISFVSAPYFIYLLLRTK